MTQTAVPHLDLRPLPPSPRRHRSLAPVRTRRPRLLIVTACPCLQLLPWCLVAPGPAACLPHHPRPRSSWQPAHP